MAKAVTGTKVEPLDSFIHQAQTCEQMDEILTCMHCYTQRRHMHAAAAASKNSGCHLTSVANVAQ
jgi:hypothetical protein